MIRFIFLFAPLFLLANWAEETLANMTLDQKIGQLFMAPACPLRDTDHFDDWQKLMKECHIGNAIVKQSDPITQVQFLNRLQAQSAVPLLVSADAEWGLAMRMSNTIAFPRNMTLGAIDDLQLIYRLGQEIGRQAHLVGVHLNLAPVADVNNNPANPIIHMRSFGEDPERVAAFVSAYAQGLQAGGTLGCAKHFPGHGDTTVDSHRDLPILAHSRERLEQVELIPFKQMVEEGIAAIMTAHLYVPTVDPIYPTSLSKACLDMVRALHFHGLIISDALNMKALADRYSPEEIALLARKAGCDILLYGDHIDPHVDQIVRQTIPRAFTALKKGYLAGELDLAELDASVLRILRAKERIQKTVPLQDLLQKLQSEEALNLKRELFQEAVTLIGEPAFPVPPNRVVVTVHSKETLTPEFLNWVDSLGEKAIICLFASPYLLKHFKNQKTILVGYENDPDAQQAVFNVLSGKEQATGHLPVSIPYP